MAEIFNIQLETDLSEFDSTVTDGGDLSQDAAAALAATSGGLSCLIDDTTLIYGQKDFTQLTSQYYRFRFYIDVNTLNVADYLSPALIRAGADNLIAAYLNSDQHLYIRYRNDAGTWFNTTAADVSTGEHRIEVLVQYASSAIASDAIITFWVNDAQIDQDTGLDIYDLAKPDNARLGANAINAGTSGTHHLDEFILRNDDTQIGPVPITAALCMIL